VPPSPSLSDRNLAEAVAHLTKTRGFRLSDGDRSGMAYVLDAWLTDGPDIQYRLTGGGRGTGTTYAALMTSTDGAGKNWSYLASEETFRFLKGLHTANRIVPVVGNFGGSKALRAVARYLREQKLVVGAFYTSNVQQYLRQSGIWDVFCANAAMLPIDTRSTVIYSERGGFQGALPVPGGGFRVELQPLAALVSSCGTR
jgi:hypothetical protein